MKCKKCGSDLISFGFKESSEKSVKRKTSFFLCTFKKFLNLMHLRTMVTSPKKERHNKNKNQTTKICDL